jgi:hypothetical protein
VTELESSLGLLVAIVAGALVLEVVVLLIWLRVSDRSRRSTELPLEDFAGSRTRDIPIRRATPKINVPPRKEPENGQV